MARSISKGARLCQQVAFRLKEARGFCNRIQLASSGRDRIEGNEEQYLHLQ